jgi:hypothetical protein
VTSLVIVDRNRADVFERLANRFAREPNIRVMFDRRRGPGTPPENERRDEVAMGSLADGYVIIRRP